MSGTSTDEPTKEEEVLWTEANHLTTSTDDDDRNDWGLTRLFTESDKIRRETFQFQFEPNIRILLSGQKEENGQVLNSTGLTLWSASRHMCSYLVDNPDLIQGKRVLEVGIVQS